MALTTRADMPLSSPQTATVDLQLVLRPLWKVKTDTDSMLNSVKIEIKDAEP